MSKIIKNVVLGDSCGGMVVIAEMLVDHNGKNVYISASDMGEDALYYVTTSSKYELLSSGDEEKIDANEKWEIGPVDDYAIEPEMAKSEYYDCFKYIHSIIGSTYPEEGEYTEDYGKDVEEMDLPVFAEEEF